MPQRLRVKLVTLPWELEVPTLSLASLAAVTPERWFDTCIVDALRRPLVVDEPVDLVGISASTPSINAAYRLAGALRRRGAVVVIGGHHATALPDEALAHADAVVCGEGETSWMRICQDLLSGRNRVQGVYRDPPPDLSKLPQPRIDLMGIERYQPFYYPIIASRGCPERCSFCFSKRMTKEFRTYPIEHVLEQVRRRPPWVKAMYFVDDNLAGDPEYARELFRVLAREGAPPFGMQVRHEFAESDEDLALAAAAGCTLVSCGYESVNQASLDGTNKQARAGAYVECIQRIQHAGMIASGNWMFGFDWDGPETFAETLDFLDRSELMHASFTTEIPFPGTGAWRRYRRAGRLLTEHYDRYTGKDEVVVRPMRMTPEQLRDGIRWITLQYYSIERRTRLHRLAARKYPRLLSRMSPVARAALLGFMNYYQVVLWNLRMNPFYKQLYRGWLRLNPLRWPGDALRGTNFAAA